MQSRHPADAADEQVLVGVLEEMPGVYVGESSRYAVRVLFRQAGQDWQPFQNECENAAGLASIVE